MTIDFVRNAGTYITTQPAIAFAAVFLGGLLTALSPCVLAMIPLSIGLLGGQVDGKMGPRRAFLLSLLFVLGLGTTFSVLGATAALAGSLYGSVPSSFHWILAAVCVVMGLHLMGLIHVSIPLPYRNQPRVRGPLGAFLLGLLFGTVSTPCATPILVVLLAYLAGTGASLAYGTALLLTYALGHSVLVLLAGTSMGLAQRILDSARLTKATNGLRRASGGLVILVGVYLLYTGIR